MARARNTALLGVRKYGLGIAFLVPALLVFAVFLWWPIVQNFILAFQSYVPGFPKEWSG
jgi:ABC-type sugar transport system permease subunit